MKFSLIIPTRNAGSGWNECISAIRNQSVEPDKILVIDSTSIDDTAKLAREAGFSVEVIAPSNFNHGATRQSGVRQCSAVDIHVFITQDAILADADALKNLIAAFENPNVGMAYGRQLPRRGAGLLESHARYFNYPKKSGVRSMADRHRLGMKTVFTSNSFAAYRASALDDAGGFPGDTIVSEDMYVAARMLQKNWRLAYCADALVYHSHGYSLGQEFGRYFDIGVFNSRESWIRREFGNAESEGSRFLRSELSFVLKSNPWLLPEAMLRTGLKFLGYRLGLLEARIPFSICKALSMQKHYWRE